MPTNTTYPSIPIPTDSMDSMYQSVLTMRQTVQLLIVNAQQATDQTLSKASQIFSKKSDHTDTVNTLNNGLSTVNKAITNISQSLIVLQNSVTALQGQMSALNTRVSAVENNIVTIENDIALLDDRITTIEDMTNHDVRVRTISTTLNNAVANNAVLQFDTIDFDTDGFAPITATFDHVTIPAGLGGVYVFTAWASGSGNQSTTLGMGILVNGVERFPVANQSISGPGSVNYVLSTPAIQTMRLSAGDIIQLVNTSVTGGTNIFTGVTMSLVRIEVP